MKEDYEVSVATGMGTFQTITGENGIERLNHLLSACPTEPSHISRESLKEFFDNRGAISIALSQTNRIIGIACLIVSTEINRKTAKIDLIVIDKEYQSGPLLNALKDPLHYVASNYHGIDRVIETAPEHERRVFFACA